MNWFLLIGACGVAGYWGLLKVQRFLIYPSNQPVGSRELVDTPDKYGLDFEDITIDTEDGEQLRAYLLMRATGSHCTVVMLGPNAGNMGHSLPYAKLFYQTLKCNVLTVSYRGYGKSTGSPSESGLKRDADAILKYISSHRELSSTSIVLYGRSLGGAVAIYSASTKLGREHVSGMILENTFLSIPKLVDTVMPVAYYLKPIMTEIWRSEETILKLKPGLKCLFLGSGKDELVPPAHFRELFELCPCTEKQFVQLPDGCHNDAPYQPNYWLCVTRFLNAF